MGTSNIEGYFNDSRMALPKLSTASLWEGCPCASTLLMRRFNMCLRSVGCHPGHGMEDDWTQGCHLRKHGATPCDQDAPQLRVVCLAQLTTNQSLCPYKESLKSLSTFVQESVKQ